MNVDHLKNVYMFKEGHLRTSSEVYDLYKNNILIHLTNYSLQKKSVNFQKHEVDNEISFGNFNVNFFYKF